MELEVEANRAPVARENESDPVPQEQQDVEMLVETPIESASVNLGRTLLRTVKNVFVCDPEEHSGV